MLSRPFPALTRLLAQVSSVLLRNDWISEKYTNRESGWNGEREETVRLCQWPAICPVCVSRNDRQVGVRYQLILRINPLDPFACSLASPIPTPLSLHSSFPCLMFYILTSPFSPAYLIASTNTAQAICPYPNILQPWWALDFIIQI
jgi:hypothetical protein